MNEENRVASEQKRPSLSAVDKKGISLKKENMVLCSLSWHNLHKIQYNYDKKAIFFVI